MHETHVVPRGLTTPLLGTAGAEYFTLSPHFQETTVHGIPEVQVLERPPAPQVVGEFLGDDSRRGSRGRWSKCRSLSRAGMHSCSQRRNLLRFRDGGWAVRMTYGGPVAVALTLARSGVSCAVARRLPPLFRWRLTGKFKDASEEGRRM